MEKDKAKEIFFEIVAGNGSQFRYTVSPFKMSNFLGNAVVVLQEYIVENIQGEVYTLYKTDEGNWYDIDNNIPVAKQVVLRDLKMAIDKSESKA